MKDLNFTLHRQIFMTERITRIENAIDGLKISLVNDSPAFKKFCQKKGLAETVIPLPAVPASMVLSQAKRMFFPNLKALADFFCCSYTTAKRWKKQLRIPSVQTKNEVLFFVPDVMTACEKDPVVKNQFLKSLEPGFRKKYLEDKKAKLAPSTEIIYETELYPGRFVDVKIKYQGWRTHACFPYYIWNNKKKVIDYIRQLILTRHEKHPFKIAPLFN